MKERILQEARTKRPEGVMFLNDFSKKTLERRAEKIPDMLNARREGKIAYMIMDKLIIHDRHERGKSNPGRPPDDASATEYSDFVNVDNEVFVKNGRKRR